MLPDVKPIIDNRRYSLNLVKPTTPNVEAETTKVVDAANQRFKIRGWSAEFLAERIAIALRYISRSEYAYTTGKFKGRDGEITGTIGLTSASYDLNGKPEQLPMEESHDWDLPRPIGRDGKGVIFEARTYSMDPEYFVEVFPYLFSELARMVRDRVGEHPELLNEPIIYTYGDALSIRMYRMMGFELVDEIPPKKHEGTTWRVLRITPSRLLQNMKRIEGGHWIDTYQDVITMRARDGSLLRVDGHRLYFITGGKIGAATLSSHTRLANGIVIRKGGRIGWNSDGGMSTVSGIRNRVEIVPRIFTSKGGEVNFHRNGRVASVNSVGLDSVANVNGTLVSLQVGSNVELDETGRPTFISNTRYPAEVIPGVVARRGSAIRVQDEGQKISISNLAHETDFGDGLIGAKGATVTLERKDDGRYQILSISVLATPWTGANWNGYPRSIEKGDAFHWTTFSPVYLKPQHERSGGSGPRSFPEVHPE